MKNIIRISALMCAMAFLTTSCVKDELFDEPQQKPAAVGDEIIFGSRAGFENSDKTTRTVYSGETYEVTENGVTKTFERIDWVDGEDMVQIYCPEAKAKKVADYIVRDASKDENGTSNNDTLDEGYLENLNANVPEAALMWGSDNHHTFYAMYPAPSQFKEATVAMGIQMVETTLHGIVPSSQVPADIDDEAKNIKNGLEEKDGNFILHPNMDYAYMAAKAVASPEDGAVSLNFVPIVTAVEIELKAEQETKIAGIKVSSDNQYLTGPFTADLSDTGWPVEIETDEKTGKETLTYTNTYPDCINEPSCSHTFNNNDGESYTVDIKEGKEINVTLPEIITLNENNTLKFTVFLRPGTDYSNLKVEYSINEAAWVSKVLGSNEEPVNIPAHRKTKILGVRLPEGKIDWDSSNWMTKLDDDTKLAYLSLPGTGGSFSYKYNETTPDPNYQQQTLDIDNQWKAGIRAFEIVVDRNISTNWFGLSENKVLSLDDEDKKAYVKCNKTSTGITFNDAMQGMEQAVADHPNECAVVIITYQPEGNLPNRNATKFAQSLKMWWDGIGTNRQGYYKKYTPDATLRGGENSVEGKVLVIVRPNQKDEKDGGDFEGVKTELTDCPFVLIDGCGTAKDRWGARGYTINGKEAPHISNQDYDNDVDVIENHMEGSNNIFPDKADGNYGTDYANGTITRPQSGDEENLKFEFYTQDNVMVWYQEWARVVKAPLVSAEWSAQYTSGGTITWFESLREKKSNIEVTLSKALSYNPAAVSDNKYRIFINSLCGYLVTSSFADSYCPSIGLAYGGSGGNIVGLANELNPWFYDIVKGMQLEQATGPTGIVLMDRVTATDEVIGLIIANNFKYDK